mmetsp:Transcript_6810/g.11477  ORF Transcript_6810/g.11477 Transcript_6810/m.11477 type:complete len:102 (-) Transcript_6810:481-786(-)
MGSTKGLNEQYLETELDSSSLSPQFSFLNSNTVGDEKNDHLQLSINFQANGAQIRSISIIQSIIFSINYRIEADFKLTLINNIQTPAGFSELEIQGPIVMN